MYSVAEVASRLGLSEQRVRQLVVLGRIPGERIGGRWLIDEKALDRLARHSRGMSPRMAWAMIGSLEGPVSWVAPSERSRIRKHLQRLVEDPDRVNRLQNWLVDRAERRSYAVGSDDVGDVLADDRIFPSGVSDRRAGLSAGGEVEAYVRHDQVEGLVREFLMVSSARPNVVLHVVEQWPELGRPMPVLAVIADLAEQEGPREHGQAEQLLIEHLERAGFGRSEDL